ncbi:MAG: cyclic nucleotide-binding domain-containing protein [Verrucomicrobiia bacterium]
MKFKFDNIPIFAGLNDKSLAFLEKMAKCKKFKKGEFLIRQDTEGNTFFLLASGRVEIVILNKGRKKTVLSILGPNSCFGEMALIECMKRSASVRALTSGKVYILSNADLYHLYQQFPAQYAIVILNIARDLCRRIRELNNTFVSITR